MEDKRAPVWLYGFILLLLLPALLINLGVMTVIDDEGIRALVALEMDLSGNLVTPTLHGEYYYKKPPLFNWILLAWFHLSGKISEFTARIPTVLALLGYCGTIFYFLRKHYPAKTAFLNALVFLTCGRILFWDSMLALIDITFSWVVFTSFMLTYHLFERKRYGLLFVLTYVLTAIGFLLKGLPAIVFQGITLLTWFVYRRQFRQLFTWRHVLGGSVFLILVGGYYLLYHQYNSLENVFTTLFTESSQRTPIEYGVWNTILHVLTFPAEMAYHFLPWSLLVIYFFRRDIRQIIQGDRFLTFNVLVFLTNVLVYWVSPEVYPRYLLMLAPLIFASYLHMHQRHKAEKSWQYRTVQVVFGALLFILALVWWPLPFFERTELVAGRWWKAWSVAALSAGLAVAYYRLKSHRFLVLGAFLLVFRIGFNFFILPDRNAHDFGDLCRQTSIAVGEQYAEQPLYVYGDSTIMQPTNSFYLTHARGAIIPRVQEKQPAADALYIIYPEKYPDVSYQVVDSILVRHGKRTYHIGRMQPN